jgi:phosphoesterase RecJ-like protein
MMKEMRMTNSVSTPLSSPFRIYEPQMSLPRVIEALQDGMSFLLTTHKDPDADGLGSMLALGKALMAADKDVVLLTDAPVPTPYNRLKGADRIVQRLDSERHFDAAVALDCSELERMGALSRHFETRKILINIDHHETNSFFGDLNLVDISSSSTGELVFQIIKRGGFSFDPDIAENIFAAIQTDTGSFRYANTSSACLRIAAEMLEQGAKPWELSLRVMDGCNLARLRLLEMALGTLEFYHRGKIGMMTLFMETFGKAGAGVADSERFVDYPRFVSGVELAVLIRQTGEDDYKFSLRSNSRLNAAQLAARFGGGGHARAAGLEVHGPLGALKRDFLKEAIWFLDGTTN